MKKFYFLLFLIGSISGFAQVPDSLLQMSQFDNDYYRDLAYNSSHSFMTLHSDRIIRWERDGDTSGFAIPGMKSFNNIFRLTDGQFVVMGKSVANNKAMITKVDSSGSVLWDTEIDKNLSITFRSLFEKPDGSLIIGGGANSTMVLANIRTNGDTLKVVTYPTYSFTGITDIVATADGNYLASGFSDDYPLAAKIDANLDTTWTFFEQIFISFTQIRSFEQSNGNFDLYAGKVRVTLDANGQKLMDTVHLNSYNINDAVEDGSGFLSVGSYGNWNAADRGLAMVKFNSAGDSLDAYTFTVPDFIGGFYRRVIDLPNGNYAALGYHRDSINTASGGYVNIISIFGQGSNISRNEWSEQSVNLYPNPAMTFFRIEGFQGPVQLVNSRGQLVNRIWPSGEKYLASELKTGIYIVLDANGQLLGRLVKK